jgi:hypothetical protein
MTARQFALSEIFFAKRRLENAMRAPVFLALSHPRAGREAEFHDWYDRHHLRDVVTIASGFANGRRYWQASDTDAPRWGSLAIYELDAPDVAAMHAGVREVARNFTPANGVFEDDHVAWVYAPTGPVESSDDWRDLSHAAAGEAERGLMLVFGNEPAAGLHEPALRIQHFTVHPDQRAGIDVPWSHMAMIDLNLRDEAVVRRAYGDSAAAWLYAPRGVEIVR